MAIRPELVLTIAILTISLVNVRRRRAAIGEHAARGGAAAAAAAAAALVKGSARAPPWKSRLPLRLKSQERMDSRKEKKNFQLAFKVQNIPFTDTVQTIQIHQYTFEYIFRSTRFRVVLFCGKVYTSTHVAVHAVKRSAAPAAGDELTKKREKEVKFAKKKTTFAKKHVYTRVLKQ